MSRDQLALQQIKMASMQLGGARKVPSNVETTKRFVGQSIIVTGGASGICKATVDRLSREGASVAIFDINEPAGKEVAAFLSQQGQSVCYYNVDVSDKNQCSKAVRDFASKNGRVIHGLVNGAVYFGSKALDAEKQDWDKSFGVNVAGYANMVQCCFPYMKASPPGPESSPCRAVVNVASISGHIAQPHRWTYSATKGAILSLTKCMALDLSAFSIRVNSVSPAWVWSPEVSKAAGGDREKWEPIWGPYHMPRRMAETSEIASVIAFLLSFDAAFITGSDIPCEGGYMTMGPEGLGENSRFAGDDY